MADISWEPRLTSQKLSWPFFQAVPMHPYLGGNDIPRIADVLTIVE